MSESINTSSVNEKGNLLQSQLLKVCELIAGPHIESRSYSCSHSCLWSILSFLLTCEQRTHPQNIQTWYKRMNWNWLYQQISDRLVVKCSGKVYHHVAAKEPQKFLLYSSLLTGWPTVYILVYEYQYSIVYVDEVTKCPRTENTPTKCVYYDKFNTKISSLSTQSEIWDLISYKTSWTFIE